MPRIARELMDGERIDEVRHAIASSTWPIEEELRRIVNAPGAAAE